MELEDESDFALSCSSELHTSERCLEQLTNYGGEGELPSLRN